MLCAGQGSQLPGLQPAHSERSASQLCVGHLPLGLGPQGCNSITGCAQSGSRVQGPGLVGVQMLRGGTVTHSCWHQGGQRVLGAATVSLRARPVGRLVCQQPGIKLCSLGILFWLTLSLCLSLG